MALTNQGLYQLAARTAYINSLLKSEIMEAYR
jgi:hypothetical protein